MTLRPVLLLAAALLAFTGFVVLPAEWFVPLPPTVPLPPPPVSGHLLVRLCLLLDGLLLTWLAVRESGAPGSAPDLRPGFSRAEIWALAGLTLAALVLRLIAVNSDLWLDELTPIRAYRDASAWQVAITYRSSNNHLLNTLLVKASIALFGEREWAIRLPAVLWGTATIPALYWVARQALSRHASFCAAGLLAVSYHHIFFSQNARGYSAYVFLSLVSSVLLVKGLATDSIRTWIAYVVTSVVNFAVLLISGFVFAAHILVGGCAVLARPAATERQAKLTRLLQVFGLTTFLGFQLYAAAIPQMYVLMRAVYTDATSGYSPFSIELVRELTRGLAAGFGPGLLLGAIPLLLLAAAGFVILLKRQPWLTLALTLPCVLQAALLLVQGFTFSPRFFILALPLAILVAMQGIVTSGEVAARLLQQGSGFARGFATVVVVVLALASLSALPHYYRTPKQSYRAALQHVDAAHRPGGIVVEIHYAEAGFHYYRRLTGLDGSPDYFQARSVAALDAIVAEHPGRPVWLVTTFHRALRMGVPDLEARIIRDWQPHRRFPATIGDGEIYVWAPKPR